MSVEKPISRTYRTLLQQAKIMVEDYEHLAPDADSKIGPLRKRRIAKMRDSIRAIETLRASAPAGGTYDPTDPLTALKDIILTVGLGATEQAREDDR